MKLEKIKLSGFKSFVDSTVIPINGNLISVVGPNGCGKSNIIDAIRWVMGESSAKYLRGGSMSDVIFNGSSSRKPVSLATVELTFDNTENKLGGEFSHYDTLAIKRKISRDGLSIYYFNGEKCRRKDITDLFLGTGLGARSYAIIEQGMISRIVEAKPDELRVHIEEAAGVSKYKERRSETETRMRHTRENLERLNDVRDEVDKQLSVLKKQALMAERYTELKAQEHQLKSELLAIRWCTYQQDIERNSLQLEHLSADYHQAFIEHKAQLDVVENKQRAYKQTLKIIVDKQAIFYQQSLELNRLEQLIIHKLERQEQTLQENKRIKEQLQQLEHNLGDDRAQLEDIQQNIIITEDSLKLARHRDMQHRTLQKKVKISHEQWTLRWDDYLLQCSSYREQVELKRVLIIQLEHHRFQIQARFQRLQNEVKTLNDTQIIEDIKILKRSISSLKSIEKQGHLDIERSQSLRKDLNLDINQLKYDLQCQHAELQVFKGKITSLEILQNHALGKDNQALMAWLEKESLGDNRRLGELITVDPEWRMAIEIILNVYLEAIVIQDISEIFDKIVDVKDSALVLVTDNMRLDRLSESLIATPLSDKIKGNYRLDSLVFGIYCVEGRAEALSLISGLKVYESIITQDGEWFGKNWIRLSDGKNSKTGIFQREQELLVLKGQQDNTDEYIKLKEQVLSAKEQVLAIAEQQYVILESEEKKRMSELSLQQAALSGQSVRLEQKNQRLEQLVDELKLIEDEQLDNAESYEDSVMIKEQAEIALEELDERKAELEKEGERLVFEVELSDEVTQKSIQERQALQEKISSLKVLKVLTEKQIKRLQTQFEHTETQSLTLNEILTSDVNPMENERYTLEVLKENQLDLESKLINFQEEQATNEMFINDLLEKIAILQTQLGDKKTQLDVIYLEQRTKEIQQQAIVEQLQDMNELITALVTRLSKDANEVEWRKKSEKILKQLAGLGAINLTAIDEYKIQASRVQFLNEQHLDLTDALTMLEEAIIKIDRESRQRFKQTFDQINERLKIKFPKLFGGGQAYLSLIDDKDMDSGVTIIAQPPGKRNSSIHLLSGGEKALTAVALVFSIFELNPAPFCLLDEVDAPLDEENVRRFSEMVKEMAENIQFIYISHNKVTMEIAEQLMGVTMKEAGVSRMVAVDIQDAVKMVESEHNG